jgi:hypothetical protein
MELALLVLSGVERLGNCVGFWIQFPLQFENQFMIGSLFAFSKVSFFQKMKTILYNDRGQQSCKYKEFYVGFFSIL